MKKRSFKTVVLSSRENFRWWSMQEIIPFIERSWMSSARQGRHEVICRNVDTISLARLLPELLTADNIVFSCFTVKIARIGELLRSSFNSDARYFLYVHNQATIACWPYHVWGLGRLLRESDVFISSAKFDADTLKHSFKKPRVEVVPFSIVGLKKSYQIPRASSKVLPFLYVGRLSEQKNLHTLLHAFKVFQKMNPKLTWELTIWGKDDNLGSPNMGAPSKKYGESLWKLSKRLGLENNVAFKGFGDRTQISRITNKKRQIIVSASVHSDENFGMAPFRAISRGHLAVLSRWGGFADFGVHFSESVFLAPVRESKKGPFVDAQEFAQKMTEAVAVLRKNSNQKVSLPEHYDGRKISDRLAELATEPHKVGLTLRKTALANRVLRRRRAYQKYPCRIFHSYSDADAKTLFRSYGMTK